MYVYILKQCSYEETQRFYFGGAHLKSRGNIVYFSCLSSLLLLGPDCSLTVPSTESFWVLPSVKPFGTSLARASHKAVVQEKVMWVVGGYTFNYSSFQMILK